MAGIIDMRTQTAKTFTFILLGLSMAGCPAKREGTTAVFANRAAQTANASSSAPLNPTGHNSEAQLRDDLQKLPESARGSYDAAYRLSLSTDRKQRNQKQARSIFMSLIEKYPSFAPAYRGIGYTFVDDGFQMAKAVEWYKKSVSKDRVYGLGHYGLAFLLPPNGRVDEGWAHFEAAMKLGIYDERNLKGKFYKDRKLSVPMPKRPSSRPASGPTTPPGHGKGDGHDHGPANSALRLNATGHNSTQSMLAEKKRLSGDAAEAYERAYRLTFTNDKMNRNPIFARKVFAKLVSEFPKFGPAYRGLGYTYVADGFKMRQAIDWYKQGVTNDPNYGLGHYGLAFLMSQTDAAVGFKHFQKAMSLGIKDERNLKTTVFKRFNKGIAPHGGPN